MAALFGLLLPSRNAAWAFGAACKRVWVLVSPKALRRGSPRLANTMPILPIARLPMEVWCRADVIAALHDRRGEA